MVHLTAFLYDRYEEKVLSRWPEIFVGCLVFVIIVVALITWRCCVRRKRRRAAAQAAKAAKLGVSANRPNTYSVVDMNSSSAQLNMHEMTPKQESWDHPYGYQQHNEYKGHEV